MQRTQEWLPLNPQKFANVTPDSSFNTAVSFATNTNWQGYGGESTMSYLTQMVGLTVQNFLSAAAGMAVLAAMIRGFRRRPAAIAGNEKAVTQGEGSSATSGSIMTRSTLYILLPLSLVLAVFLISQGVVQNFAPYQNGQLVAATKDATGKDVTEQTLPLGPAASQIAIKQLGTNGGGFFNVNSAHPFENPTPLSNFLELLSILVISGRTVLHVRRNGRRHAAGLGRARRHARDLRAAGVSVRIWKKPAIRPSLRWASINRPAASSRAATWKARKPASASALRPLGRGDHAASNGSVNACTIR